MRTTKTQICYPHEETASLTIQNAPSENSDQTANAQADLNLRWANMSAGTISAVVAHMVLKFYGPGNNVSVVSD